MSKDTSDEERYLELYLYNTNRKIRWESQTSASNNPGPDSLLEEFINVLRNCEKSKRYVTSAVCTRRSGLVYVSSEDDSWGSATPGSAPSSPSNFVQVTNDQHGRSLDLCIYNINGGTIHKTTVPNESPAAHFHLLWRFLSILEYCRTNTQLTVQNAAYTEGGASINVLGADAEWLMGLDSMLKMEA